MQCPVCAGSALLISERQGIEIDYCSKCRGVWLDRGELDKLIERSAAAAVPPSAPSSQPQQPARASYPEQQRFGHGHQHAAYGHDHKRRKKGFLGEIFDF